MIPIEGSLSKELVEGLEKCSSEVSVKVQSLKHFRSFRWEVGLGKSHITWTWFELANGDINQNAVVFEAVQQ